MTPDQELALEQAKKTVVQAMDLPPFDACRLAEKAVKAAALIEGSEVYFFGSKEWHRFAEKHSKYVLGYNLPTDHEGQWRKDLDAVRKVK
jgi:hypothetical protein